MAQIRKFQPGGKTPNTIGVLTIDGKDYTGDGFIQYMRDYRKTLDDKVADQFGNIINALEAGENLRYDSDTDVLTGNVDWNVSKSQERRLDKGEDRTKVGKVFGALNEGKEQRVRYAINALRNMGTYEEPKKEVKGKSFDWSKDINLVYSKDKDGNYGKLNEDNGTTYKYYVEATEKISQTKTSSNIVTQVRTSGVAGYSYVIDNNATTDVDNTIDTTSTNINYTLGNGPKTYLHIKTIDAAGNVSGVTHILLHENVAPEMTLTPDITTWTNKDVVITAKATDTDGSVVSIKKPDASVVNTATTTYTVSQNGKYSFTATDNSGATVTKEIENILGSEDVNN